MKKKWICLLAAVVLCWTLSAVLAAQNNSQGTKEEARAMVEKAVEWFKKYGREKTLAEITRGGTEKKGEFKDRDLYVFAYDFNGVCMAQGDNPKLVGKNLFDWQDADGRYNIRSHIDIAQKKGSGWSPVYKWINPVTKTIESKIAYIKKIDDTLWIGCGVHGKEAQARPEKKRIGVLVAFEQERFEKSLRGILDQLAQDGYKKPDVVFIVENAEGSHVRAANLVSKFSAAKLDLLITIGTIAASAAVNGIRNVPIVFSHVYDPVATGVAKSWRSSGNNSTGTTPRYPMAILVQSLLEFAPIKKLAVLYTPGERNSAAQLKELQDLQARFWIKVVAVPVKSRDDVISILPGVVQTVEAIYLSGSSIVGHTIPEIMEIANKAKVVTITHLDDLVDKGVLLGVCANSYDLGRRTGKMGVRILKGDKPAAIPLEGAKKTDLLLNMKSVLAGQFNIPPEFTKKVKRTIK
jgi:putative tryptophan/tyrosine transport system substrate-binding protein